MSDAAAIEEQGRKFNILIVDDDPNIALLVHMALSRKRSYTTDIASNGIEALKKIAANPPDIVLLDIMMPGIDGFEVCRRIRSDESTKLIPVIMISAKSEIGDKLHGIDIGANDYITKPFNPEELLARVQSHLRIRVLEGEVSQKRELEAVLKMAITLQHEINNPLTGIIGNLELMEEWRDLPDDEVDSTIKEVLGLSLRLRDIVAQMSKITKVVSTQYVPGSEMIDINQSSKDGPDDDKGPVPALTD